MGGKGLAILLRVFANVMYWLFSSVYAFGHHWFIRQEYPCKTKFLKNMTFEARSVLS